MSDIDYSLYVITASNEKTGRSHGDVARAAVEGGATVIQFRDKDMDDETYAVSAATIGEIVRSGKIMFIVNDRPRAAVLAGADGVHIGQKDLALRHVKRIIGEDMVAGVSASSFEEAMLAAAVGADYLGVGPVFVTDSKPDAPGPIGLAELTKICGAVDIPVVAIGGINESNIAKVRAAGASGAAVISSVAGAPDMIEAVRRLKKAWERT
ncbi:MAG: thiamine phosphate synthase [Actinomycetota bacterium]